MNNSFDASFFYDLGLQIERRALQISKRILISSRHQMPLCSRPRTYTAGGLNVEVVAVLCLLDRDLRRDHMRIAR